MKKVLLAAAAVMALPAIAEAQDVQTPGVYIGVEGGLNWLFNTTILGANVSPQTGWALGGKIGYDFIGPRIEVEGLYRQNQTGPDRRHRQDMGCARQARSARSELGGRWRVWAVRRCCR